MSVTMKRSLPSADAQSAPAKSLRYLPEPTVAVWIGRQRRTLTSLVTESARYGVGARHGG
jgi:hypothetical protein